MQDLYNYLFGWCTNDVEMMFSLFIFMFTLITLFSAMRDIMNGGKGMMH